MKLANLFEDIFRSLSKPGLLSISVNTHEKKHRGGDRESIATSVPLPLRMTASKTRGVPVYYAYNYLHSEEVTELLKAIKGKGGDLKADDRQLNRFFDDTASYMVAGLKQRKIKPDIVVCPASSSTVTREFAMRLAKALDNAKVVTDAFLKQKAFKLEDDRTKGIEQCKKFVDMDLIKAKYHGADADKFATQVATSVYQSIKKHGSLELKDVYKQFGKFVKGFMDKQPDVEYELMDKEVLVVDDVLSSGSTMSEMMRLVKDECMAKTVNGAVIFNMTTAKS